MKLTVPTSLADIDLKTYLAYDKATTPHEKIATLLNIDITTFRRIEKHSLKEIDGLLSLFHAGDYSDYKLQPTVVLGGVKLGFVPDLHSLTLGEFSDLETLCKDPMANLTEIISILYRPIIEEYKDSYKIEPYTSYESKTRPLEMKMDAVMGMLGFFLNIGLKFSMSSLRYLKAEMATI